MKCEDIKRRFSTLESDRKNLDGVLDIIRKFFMPLRSEFFRDNTNEHMVDWRSREVFDSTAVEAVDTLSASMQGSLTSMATKWFELKMRDKELNKNKEVQLWLEASAEEMWRALQESNFDIEASEYYIDLTGFGTSILTEEVEDEKSGRVVFKAIPVDSCYFEEDHMGRVINFYQKLMWTPLQIIEKFGEDGTPQWIKDAYAANKSDKITIIYCIYKRPANKGADTSLMLAPNARPYGYKYVCHKDAEQLGQKGGYYEMPAFVSRWRKTPGSAWGYGPAHLCLSDVLTLNELTSDLLEAVGKAIDPTTVTTQRNLMSDLDLGRGGLTVVKDIKNLIPFESRARFDVGELKIERLQDAIRRAFRIDQLQLKDSPAMTATESNIRYELMQRLLGPTLGRLKNDFLDPMVERTFNILFRAGRLPEMPEIMRNAEMDIEYVGPMARSQKSQTSMAIQQWIGALSGLAEAFPEVMDVPDADNIARGLAELGGVPATMSKGKQEVDALRAERKQAQIDQQNQDGMGGMAAAMKDGAGAMKILGEMQ